MDRLLEQVKKNIYDNCLIENNDVIIIGVSGGPDSIFLLHALATLKPIILKEKNIDYTVHVAHINHMIREEAEFDANIARKLATSYNVAFHILEADVITEAKRLKIGTEECGRNIRYEFFNEVAKTVGGTKIAVAHNAGDNAETIILNFIRGAGLKGLSGIDMKSNKIIRPILNISKQDIVKYLDETDIEYAIDKTNLENDYTRNKVRNDLIHKIEQEYNPNIINALNRMAVVNKLDLEIIEQAVEEKYLSLNIRKEKGKIYINTKEFNKNSTAMKYQLIRRILMELIGNLQGVEMVHIKDTCRLIESSVTRKQYILGNKYKVVIEKKNIAVFVNNM